MYDFHISYNNKQNNITILTTTIIYENKKDSSNQCIIASNFL